MKRFGRNIIVLFASGILAGCVSNTTNSNTVVTSTTDTTTTNTVATNTTALVNATPNQTFALNQPAKAGDITHTITSVEVLDTIPQSYTLPEWRVIAEDLPAVTDMRWVHIKGTVTNNSQETQTVNSTSLYLQDDDDNEYDVSTDTTIYVPDAKSPIYITVEAGQTVDWEGYFMVPKDAAGLHLVANDLSFVPKDEVKIDLGISD